MINLPPEPSPGDKITAEIVRDIIRAIRERTIISTPGCKASPTPNGTLLSVAAPTPKPAASKLPWTFACSESEGQNGGQAEREGGWTNCMLQLGYNFVFISPDIKHVTDETGYFVKSIGGTDETADGEYWVEVNVADKTAVIKRRESSSNWTIERPHDFENNIVRIYIGTVDDAKQTYGMHVNPVVYTYI